MNQVAKISVDKPRKRKKNPLIRYADDYLFILPYMLLFVVFTVLPVLISIFLSFTYFNVLEAPEFVGLNNYFRLIMQDSLFMIALKNTLVLAVVTGPVSFFLCLLLAWLVNEFPPKLRAVFTLLFYAPTLSGGAYMVWSIILNGDSNGLLNSLLMSLGLTYSPIQWLTDTNYMMGTAIAVILWMSLGTSFLSFIAGYQNVDRSLYEAGSVDGIKNRWQELWYITLPSMRPQLMFGAVMSITTSFGVGDIISGLFGFPSTNYALHTLVHLLQDYGNVRFEMGYASAIATMLFVIMVGSTMVVQRLLKKLGG